MRLAGDPRRRRRLFAALDLANRCSITIPKSAQLLLTACSNFLGATIL
jgi:hypothetical protein